MAVVSPTSNSRLASGTTKATDCPVAEISPLALARVADYFKMLSEVSRLQILCALQQGSLNVSEIMAATGMGQANVSKHLKLLTQAGLVHRHPQGVSVYYEIANPAIFELCEVVCKQLLVQHTTHAHELEQLAQLHRPRSPRDPERLDQT